jgi:hypothetical protein
VAYASSAAFDRDEDAATLAAVSLLMVLAHPAPPAGDTDDDDDSAYDLSSAADWDDGDDDPRGRYCMECGANSHYECDCPCPRLRSVRRA